MEKDITFKNHINNENNTISLLQYIGTIVTVALFSAYFFTRGYIHSFSLPIRVDLLESGYFMLTLIADGILPIIFPVFTNIYILAIILVAFANIRFRFINFRFFSKLNFSFIKVKNITPLSFLIYFMLFIFFLKIILDSKLPFYKLQKFLFKIKVDQITDSNVYTKKIYSILFNFLDKIISLFSEGTSLIFSFSLIIIVFSMPIFISLFFKTKDFFKVNPIKNSLIFISIVLISASSSYFLGKDYSGKFVYHYEYRNSTKTKERVVQIWKSVNYYFYVKCKDYGVSFIEGVNKNDKIFYVGYIDKLTHHNICR